MSNTTFHTNVKLKDDTVRMLSTLYPGVSYTFNQNGVSIQGTDLNNAKAIINDGVALDSIFTHLRTAENSRNTVEIEKATKRLREFKKTGK